MLHHLPGHRLFFPAACFFAAISLSAWTAELAGLWSTVKPFDGPLWFIHEIVFGFVPGMVAGYLTLMSSGPMVLLAFLLWLAGRVLVHLPPYLPVEALGAIDAAFPIVMVLVCGRALGRGWRFIPVTVTGFAVLLGLLNFWAYLIAADQLPGLALRPLYAGTILAVAILANIGGRLLGTYLRIYLGRAMTHDRGIEVLSMSVSFIALIAWIAEFSAVAGGALIALGLVQLIRLLGWWDRRISNDPLLSAITAGFFWMAAAAILWGSGHIFGVIPAAAGVHLLLIASVGPIVCGMALRLTRSRRMPQILAARLPVFAFWLLTGAALLRLASDMAIIKIAGTGGGLTVLAVAAAAWTAAYLILAVALGSASVWLTRKRATA